MVFTNKGILCHSFSDQRCPCGQQCLYVARGVEENVILASHITPVIRSDPFQSTKAGVRYIDDLFFRVSDGENGSCDVFGHSHSTVSFESHDITIKNLQGPAYYDFTTNYCNLRNLMVGSGLANLDGYRLPIIVMAMVIIFMKREQKIQLDDIKVLHLK